MKILGVLSFLLPALALGVVVEAGPAASISIQIRSIQPLGEDEVVTVVNRGDSAVDLTGWRLESSNSLGWEVKETFWFPGRCLLPAGGTLRVHSGPYARSWGDRSCGHRQIDLPWTEAKIWNDDADVAWLRDPSGKLVDLHAYTASAEGRARPKPRSERRYRRAAPVWKGCYPPDGGCCACAVKVILVSIGPTFVPTIPPSPAPSADFTVSPPGAHRVGDVVTLDGSPSRGEGLSYGWDFDGDGRADAAGIKVTHRLAYEGMNLITLTVTDRWGQSDSITRGIRALYGKPKEKGIDLGLLWLTLPALAVGYFLVMAFRS